MRRVEAFDRAVPNLPSRDSAMADGWSSPAAGYSSNSSRTPDIEPATSDFTCSIRVSELDQLYDAIRLSGVAEHATGAPRLQPVRIQTWGLRAGYLIDLAGTQLALIGAR